MTRRHELPVRVFSSKSKKIKMKIQQGQSGGGKDGDWWRCFVGGERVDMDFILRNALVFWDLNDKIAYAIKMLDDL